MEKAQPVVATATPVQQQPQSQPMMVQVPQGMMGGMMMQVQTPAGLMQVTIPQGLQSGGTFQMMVPMPQQAMAQPVQQQQQQQQQM